ncbi:hypothetical protein ENSA5_24820 [Enhygromyxa salina]|uniref:Uncharacterized protein n=1 Tax=Enhygromyxa salina TaxID=215803 RepID=A0A2S9YB64_9BACT|nr:hypothetical protein [Enhygromyxa salina]PRQ02246.1 hypothetical protein ENSA5_24820 [Enhygromyxa salina]
MLGGLLTVGVVMAYELDFIEREPAPCECASAADDDPRSPKPQRPSTAGARPHPSTRGAETQALALEDRVALLEAQNELLAERNVTGEMSYYGLSQAELEAMARHCDIRMDYPKRLAEQEAEDLGLEPAEREAWDRALQAFADQEQAYYGELLREIDPSSADIDELSLAQIRRQLTRVVGRGRGRGDDSLQRDVAEERAGLREPPAEPEALSPWNRYNRLRFSAGDRFAELLDDELGHDRVHELRSVFEGWPGARTRQWGCPGEAHE